MGSREDVAAKIDADTKVKIEEMNKAVVVNKQAVIEKILELVYDIKPELHKNFKATANKE
jgi:V-type H+-transporting ATPase subunit G